MVAQSRTRRSLGEGLSRDACKELNTRRATRVSLRWQRGQEHQRAALTYNGKGRRCYFWWV